MRGYVLTGLLAISSVMPSPTLHAQEASFDCAKAATAAETAICRSPSLGGKDIRMATLFHILQSLTPGVAGMAYREFFDQQRREQAAWLQNDRASCGASTTCLTAVYDRRTATLERVLLKNAQLTYGRRCDGCN
jgi:uncharacterized protein